MRSAPLLLVLLALVACASTETAPGADRRGRYLGGYAAQGPVAPAEYTYENRDAALRFPAAAADRTFTRLEDEALEGGADLTGSGAAGLFDDGYDRNEYGWNDYGGAGHRPPPVRPRPPVVRPPEKPEPPVARPLPERPARPSPAPGDRRKATSPPERPGRSRGATQAPGTSR